MIPWRSLEVTVQTLAWDKKTGRIHLIHQVIISSRFYEPDYNNITKKLLYEDVSYDEAIAGGIAKVADLDVFLYKKWRRTSR